MNFLKRIFHIFEGILAEIIFGFPSKRIKIIGVTGTDGKTTTSHLIYHILKSCDHKPSMISSIYADTGDTTYDTGFHTTTPRPIAVRKFLKAAVQSRCDYFILETTSHALSQGRVWGIPYQAGVITNVTHEHQLHHKSFDNYLRSKVKLLIKSKNAYVNKDMQAYKSVRDELKKRQKSFFTYTTKSVGADFTWPKDLITHLNGEYNRQNVMAAYSVVSDIGVTDAEFIKALKSFKLPQGRFDVVYNKSFTVIIDFAHTPNSVNQILSAVRENYYKKGKSIIHVFGSASERDDSKRPLMGRESARLSDKIILTEEDRRREDISKIFSEIEKGILKEKFTYLNDEEFSKTSKKKIYTKVPNRYDAISLGISVLKPGDIFITTGKSHEKSLNRDGVEEPWDEYDAVRMALKKYFSINL
ncbi:hypothetical protein A2690_02440 [Candidatus Roizmanbacteria bacterium RIFCSPHIGHO2_01_FULL_39_12b]|uniref:UDP-N-acetylmuramoyl-L-alanyl-D-glutamate--2, 6-diaminopimelate ligase n=1 Tax=Candidatus Roizmanbacteria bacterium RIFCSPHIGHO2_01_FULL_39_12b TaxID=1802030 RepID=A0A1F7GDS0_9BACT|nr:MAG: hypothetical protein A2690_02440 [Candidatus Roizmanbacteria bacterium RIFCSPHIGHO2_01_FULL_39_12b]OGK46643.1 MAG: hypothetical protein A3B46_00360 [Candidatus Roizmanbacteria bacterium RIFCSPLOWO2_01_FULL_39_19]